MIELDSLRGARWFGGKSRAIRDTRVVDRARWIPDAWVRLLAVEYESGPPETYVVADRFEEPDLALELLDRFRGATLPTEAGGSLAFRPTHVFQGLRTRRVEPVAAMKGEQSNSSVRFDDSLILKLFRRLQYGPNPDVEIGWYLTESTSFRGSPAVAGTLEYTSPQGETASLALLQRFEPNRGDAWTTTLGRVRQVLEGAPFSESVDAVARLGRTTAELHLALASGSGDFSAESIRPEDINQWRRAILDEVRAAADALARHGTSVDFSALVQRADGIAELLGALKTRHHGDYHLGQVLERDDGAFVIIDFEGEPAKPLAQRREKRSPLRDVAGMLRSFDYARHAALRSGSGTNSDRERRGAEWYAVARQVFLSEYLSIASRHPGMTPKDVDPPLAALELEKAAYEVLYELNNRPDWLVIPLATFTQD